MRLAMNYDSMSNKYIGDFSTVFCVVGVALFQLFTYLDVISFLTNLLINFECTLIGNRCSFDLCLENREHFWIYYASIETFLSVFSFVMLFSVSAIQKASLQGAQPKKLRATRKFSIRLKQFSLFNQQNKLE